jgi:hypothetical protein
MGRVLNLASRFWLHIVSKILLKDTTTSGRTAERIQVVKRKMS